MSLQSTSLGNLQKTYDDLITKLDRALNSYKFSRDSKTSTWLQNVLDSLDCWLVDVGNDSELLNYFEQTPLGVSIQVCLSDITSQLDNEIQSSPQTEPRDGNPAQDRRESRHDLDYQAEALSRNAVTDAIVQLQDLSEAMVTHLAAHHGSGPLKSLKAEIDRVHDLFHNVDPIAHFGHNRIDEDTTQVDDERRSPVHDNSSARHLEVTQWLADHRTDIETRGEEPRRLVPLDEPSTAEAAASVASSVPGLRVVEEITAVVAMTDNLIKMLGAAPKVSSLPKPFSAIESQLLTVLATLQICQRNLTSNPSIPEDVCLALGLIVSNCGSNIRELRKSCETVLFKGSQERRRLRFGRPIETWKDIKVEKLMVSIVQDVQVLVNIDAVKSADQQQLSTINEMVREMKTLSTSPSGEESSHKVVNSRGEYNSALYTASIDGHEETVQILLNAGADINTSGGSYGSALQAASAEGHEKIVQILLNTGVDVNASGGLYGSALQTASERGHEKIVQILLDAEADVNASGGSYGSALQAASAEGHEKIVQILLNAGANVNVEGSDDNALHTASERGHEKIVQILLNTGADVNASGGLYGSALQTASERGHKKIVQILLDAGADVNASGGYYGSALQAASAEGHEKIVQMLLKAGAIRR